MFLIFTFLNHKDVYKFSEGLYDLSINSVVDCFVKVSIFRHHEDFDRLVRMPGMYENVELFPI